MPAIQFEIPKNIDKKLKHYVIDHDLKNKREAIIVILTEKLKNEK